MRDTEAFWTGEFGDEYNRRSPGNAEANGHFFDRALNKTHKINSICELGCGVGLNLCAIRRDYPWVDLAGVEINAVAALAARQYGKIYRESLLDWEPRGKFDLIFTKGVLIHIAPQDLPRAYAVLHRATERYILVAEYYNPTPVEVLYRGHTGKLWKRDFAGELMDAYDLRLLDYGFVYHRDLYPQDDLTWFLMEKTHGS